MNKIEFSDVNRFITSLGLIFIGLAFFLPWFLIQNNSILIIEQAEINKLTPIAKKTIESQQETIFTINTIFPYISIILIISGLIFLAFGIWKWNKRQTIIDKIQDEELKAKEIQNLSLQDKRELIAVEIADNEIVDNNEIDDVNQNIDNYIEIENQIYLQISQGYKNRFALTQNVKIGDYYYDIILKSKNLETDNDRIVEIKFYKNRLELDKLKDTSTRLVISAKNYDTTFKRRTLPYLLIIYNGVEFDLNVADYKTKLQNYSKTLGKIIRVKFIKQSELINLKPTDYLGIS